MEKLVRPVIGCFCIHTSPMDSDRNNVNDPYTLMFCPSESSGGVSCMTSVIWPLLADLNSVTQVEIRLFHLQ